MTAILNPEARYHELILANPRFYKNTYWGEHRGRPSHAVLSARASFMVDMKSTRKLLMKEQKYLNSYELKFGLRHLEYYTGKDNKKYQVCSQHPGCLRLTSQQMENEGWKKIHPMYNLSQDTYLRIYDAEREGIRKKIRNLLPIIRSQRDLYRDAADGYPEDQWTPGYWGTHIRRQLRRVESQLKEYEEELGYAYSEIVLA
jgi:hypothetical protein